MRDKLKILREEYLNLRITDAMDYEKFCMILLLTEPKSLSIPPRNSI